VREEEVGKGGKENDERKGVQRTGQEGTECLTVTTPPKSIEPTATYAIQYV